MNVVRRFRVSFFVREIFCTGVSELEKSLSLGKGMLAGKVSVASPAGADRRLRIEDIAVPAVAATRLLSNNQAVVRCIWVEASPAVK